jgi:hypothetical protein
LHLSNTTSFRVLTGLGGLLEEHLLPKGSGADH